MSDPDYITPEVKALIGLSSDRIAAVHPVEPSEVRRFHHAIMDPAWRYHDHARARASRYGGVVAPPLFPVLAFRRPPAAPDPLVDLEENPHDDGLDRHLRDLPPVPVPLPRLLNGGYDYSFYRYAQIGETVFRQSTYVDIYQKNGRSGAMVFIVIDDRYSIEKEELLIECRNTLILR